MRGFREGYSTQHCLLYMLEYLRKALDKGMHTGILLTDLRKAFDSLSHDILVAKLNSYGFSKLSLKMIMTTLMTVSKEPESTTVLFHGGI